MEIKNKKILATGFCGFIGSSMLPLLLAEDPSDLVVIDKLTYAGDPTLCNALDVRLVQVDIGSCYAAELVSEFKPDIILQMCAESHVDNSIDGPDEFVNSNILGNFNLLKAAVRLKELPLFWYCGTDECYGSVETGSSKEDDPRICSSPYSSSKGSAELMVEAWHKTYKLPYLITRSSNNYGPYQHEEKLIPKAINKFLRGKKMGVYGNGKNCRDWIYVEDNCLGILHAIKHGELNTAYNVGGGNVLTNNEIISLICEEMDLDYDSSVEYVTDRAGHDLRYSLDTTKLRSIGWEPKVSLKDGLKKTIDWYQTRYEENPYNR